MTQLDRVTWENEILALSEASSVGKHLPNAFYVHVSALSALPEALQTYEQEARKQVGSDISEVTLIKFNLSEPKISYLFYPTFDRDAHPPLQGSLQVNLITAETRYRRYDDQVNPPILHRKETFVTPDYPLYEQFVQLTEAEVKLGLLTHPRLIGTKREWEQRLRDRAVEIKGHEVISHQTPQKPKIDRHKAAITRQQLSRPVRVALEAELFTSGTTFFDYGCGHGGDIERIAEQGYESEGWDPYYRPDTPLKEADIVNLGYVINVIEDTAERREALLNAWKLTRRVLIVSAQVLINDSANRQVAYGDGVITRRNTFQKYYEQEELKAYIDQVLAVNAVPIGLGIYLVFRDQTQAETFRASQFRSHVATPRLQSVFKRGVRRFEDYQVLLTPLMDFLTERGRLPAKGELAEEPQIKAELGGLRRAFRVILKATDQEDWNAIARQRTEELKLYLATALLTDRPKLKDFSSTIQQDIKGLFGTFKHACAEAEAMLYSLGDQELIKEKISNSKIGLKLGKGLLVHFSCLEELHPLLRLYEACASRTIGRLEDVTVVQFYLEQPKIAYLSYPEFDSNPHPPLAAKMEINLGDLRVNYTEYDQVNPPLLHEKDKLVTPDYPLYDKFARLTKKERERGLLDDFKAIRDRRGWLKCLEEHGSEIKGHQVIWRKDIDPYRLKILKNQVRQRKRNSST